MSPILLYYLTGLALALSVGIVCYYVVGFAATPLWHFLFGSQAGPLWGRLFRMSVVVVALVGGLSTKFYGCGGPADYDAVARDHRLMLERTSTQLAESLQAAAQYLLLAAACSALAFAIYGLRGRALRMPSSRDPAGSRPAAADRPARQKGQP